MAIAKMSRVFKVLREERETISELKKMMGLSLLPPGTLSDGAEGIRRGTSFLSLSLSLSFF